MPARHFARLLVLAASSAAGIATLPVAHASAAPAARADATAGDTPKGEELSDGCIERGGRQMNGGRPENWRGWGEKR